VAKIPCTFFQAPLLPLCAAVERHGCCLSPKLHCIRPCSGQAFANSALGSKRLVTPVLKGHVHKKKKMIKCRIDMSIQSGKISMSHHSTWHAGCLMCRFEWL